MIEFAKIKVERAKTNDGFLVTSVDGEGAASETMHMTWVDAEKRINKFIEMLGRKARQIG